MRFPLDFWVFIFPHPNIQKGLSMYRIPCQNFGSIFLDSASRKFNITTVQQNRNYSIVKMAGIRGKHMIRCIKLK